jgi:hypothetical protein
MMNDDKDDSALVDSFFLPGGLFATENTNNNNNNDNIDDDDDKHHQTLLRHPTSASATETANRNPLSPIPSNPWETNTNTTTVQITESKVVEEQFMPSPLSLTNTNSDVHRIDLRNDNDDGGANRVDDDLYGQQFQHRQGEGTVGASIENSLFYHKQEVIFNYDNNNNNNNNDIKDKKSIRPPPGFQNESTTIDYNDNIHVTNNITQKATNNNQIYNNNTTMGFSTTLDNNRLSSKLRTKNNLHDPTIKRPMIRRCQKSISKSVERVKAIEDSPEIRALIIDNNDLTQQQQQQQQFYKSHDTILSHLNNNDDSSDATPATYNVPEELMSPITIGTKESSTSSCKSIDLEDDFDDDDDDDDDGDDDDDDQHEEENTTIDYDIPMSICGSLAGESNGSSLSTSSDVDNSDNTSHTTSDNNPRHNEGVGYDTDQARVSQIVDVIGSSSDGKEIIGDGDDDDDDDDDRQSISPTISTDESFKGEKQTSIPVCPPLDQPKNKKCHHRAADRIIHSSWQRLIVFLRSIAQYLSKATSDGINMMSLGIRRSSLLLKVRKVYEISSQQITSLSQEFHKISIWLKDVKEVFQVLTIQLLKKSLKILATTAKAIMIAGSFAVLMWKCSVLEALEEFNVTICYLVFYLMPMMCSLLMDWINLPHWTPHMITLLTVFPLCRQVKAGTLHQNDVSIYYLIGKFFTTALTAILPASTNNTLSIKDITSESSSSTEIITQQHSTQQQQQQQRQQQQQQDEVTRPRDEQICCNILRVLRFVLPVLFLADGFSSQFGTIIGVSGSNRLTTAFMMSLIRKNILSSPLGVISWSIQVMIATYYNSWDLIDYVILVIGLSSIRLIRYLEVIQRNKRIRHGK